MTDLLWTDIEQGTEEWHEWRRFGLGGSPAAVVMGVSPWSDPQKLFEELTGQREKPDMKFVKRLGDIAEGRITPWLKKHYDIDMKPVCVERTNPEEAWMRVSLDGWDGGTTIGEYKYANKKDHAQVLSLGVVPEKYWPQCQWQLFVTRAKQNIYVSYWEKGDDYAAVVVKPDKEYQALLYSKMLEFWNCVKDKRPPQGPKREVEGSEAWLEQLEIVKEARDTLDLQKEVYKLEFDKLTKLTKNVTTVGGGAKLTRVKGRETVDWDKVAEIKKIKENLTTEEIKKITKVGKPSWKLTYLKEK